MEETEAEVQPAGGSRQGALGFQVPRPRCAPGTCWPGAEAAPLLPELRLPPGASRGPSLGTVGAAGARPGPTRPPSARPSPSPWREAPQGALGHLQRAGGLLQATPLFSTAGGREVLREEPSWLQLSNTKIAEYETGRTFWQRDPGYLNSPRLHPRRLIFWGLDQRPQMFVWFGCLSRWRQERAFFFCFS